MLMISLYCWDNSDLPAAAYMQEGVGDETCRVVKAAVSVGKRKRSFILMADGVKGGEKVKSDRKTRACGRAHLFWNHLFF